MGRLPSARPSIKAPSSVWGIGEGHSVLALAGMTLPVSSAPAPRAIDLSIVRRSIVSPFLYGVRISIQPPGGCAYWRSEVHQTQVGFTGDTASIAVADFL